MFSRHSFFVTTFDICWVTFFTPWYYSPLYVGQGLRHLYIVTHFYSFSFFSAFNSGSTVALKHNNKTEGHANKRFARKGPALAVKSNWNCRQAGRLPAGSAGDSVTREQNVVRCALCPRTMKFICVASFILRLCLAVRDAAETLSLRLILHLSRCRHCIYIIVHINIVKSACRARAPLYKISQPFIHALAVRLRLSVSGCTLAARVWVNRIGRGGSVNGWINERAYQFTHRKAHAHTHIHAQSNEMTGRSMNAKIVNMHVCVCVLINAYSLSHPARGNYIRQTQRPCPCPNPETTAELLPPSCLGAAARRFFCQFNWNNCKNANGMDNSWHRILSMIIM